MNLERYATLERLLEPYAAQLKWVDGDRVIYQVDADAGQLRSQLALAKLQEIPLAAPSVTPPTTAVPGTAAVATQSEPAAQLRFRW